MPFLGIYGAHATGKTTALNRLRANLVGVSRHVPLRIIDCDVPSTPGYRLIDGMETECETGNWKDTVAKVGSLAFDSVADDYILTIVASVRFGNVQKIMHLASVECRGGIYIIFTTTTGHALVDFIKSRCASKGKKFRDDYWTIDKANYEARRRYVNAAQKYLAPYNIPYRIYDIDRAYVEWDEIDRHIWELVYKPLEDWYND